MKEDFQLFIVVVLYNNSIENIRSLQNFLAMCKKNNTIQLLVYDNSVSSILKENENIAKQKYMGDLLFQSNRGINKGLAQNYNDAIDYVQRCASTSNYWIMLSDDDTYFSIDYLNNVIQEIISGQNHIISGIIPNMSPRREHHVYYKNGSSIDKAGVYDNIYCINSGLVFNRFIVDRFQRYDENLFMDMVDYWLMDMLIKKGLNRISVVDGEIWQNFSGRVSQSYGQMMDRYKIFEKDFRYYCKVTGKSFLFCFIMLAKRKLHIGMLAIKNWYYIKNK